jgi:hypothetical protein
MRSVCSSFYLYLTACVLICLIGCTAAEWSQIADDAATAAPDAIGDALANPNPVSWGIILAVYLGGIVSKSVARGFGKGAVVVGKGSASVGGIILDMVLGLFSKKK